MGGAKFIEEPVLTTTITKDILTVEHGVIVHQVNCQGVMGAGLAKKIADKWPMVKRDYKSCVARAETNPEFRLLGQVTVSYINENLAVASLFGQKAYGRKSGTCYTHYRYLALALSNVRRCAQAQDQQVYLPHGSGCGLAGGDWHVVSALFEQELPDAVIWRWGD